MTSHVPLVEIRRDGFLEGRHHGTVVALAADGSVDWALGDPDAPFLPRSCNKPLQGLAMLEAGLDLPDERLLALACASHSGEQIHLDGVRAILERAGLPASALQTPPDLPLEPRVRDAILRAGGEAAPIVMNCSGKHAAMLLTCVQRGWSTDDYLDPAHPLQHRIVATFERLTGAPVAHHTTDGCGAPLLATSPASLARGFRALALAAEGPERRIADAVRHHPEMVSGTTRPERRLLAELPGAIAKMGAEACFVLALPDGRALALKIEDGADRAWPLVAAAALRRMGLEAPVLDELIEQPLLGGARRVGLLRAVF
ncbi:asparaginase [Nocardioides sp. TRM66260-LWL]|uniref:asparaginase n=1 Tax=Nocardioides sp. TRM66260-LWL TaxID=2874478 RepID=UPI001CC3D515|nr:asparaginase [Nocardioides sp. TRM66260-LWL]MBZ5734941.1 asparaginase [Nocardioides sp. TRM66260-LWL]